MAGSIGRLTVGVGLDFAEYTRGLTKMQAQTQAFAKRQDELAASASRIGTALGAMATAAAGAFVAMVQSQAEAIDRFNDLSDATGASIENISALDRLARETGGSFETVAGSLVKFNKVLNDAREPGGEAARVLKAIGLNAADLRKQDPAEALRQTAVALAQFAGDGEKARAVQVLFGKSLQEAAPFLKDLAEKGELVAQTTTAQAQAIEDYRKASFKLKADIEDLGRTITIALIPHLIDAAAKIRELFGGAQASSTVSTEIRNLSTELDKLNAIGPGFSVAGFFGTEASRKAQIAKVENELKDARARYAAIVGTSKAGAGRGFGYGEFKQTLEIPDKPGRTVRDSKTTRDAINETQRYLEALQKQIERTRELTTVEQVLADIQAGRIKGLDAAGAGKALDLAAQLDAFKRMTESIKAQEEAREALRATAQRAEETAQNEADSVAEANARYREQTELIGASREAVYAIERARISSTISLKEDALAAAQATDQTGLLTTALREQIAALQARQGLIGQRQAVEAFIATQDEAIRKAEETTAVFRDNFEGAFASFLDGTKSAKDAFKAFADGVIQDLARIAARKAAEALFGSVGTDGKTTGGVDWGSLVKTFAGFFATGGTIQPGRWGVVGENGPEPVFGGAAGKTVLPSSAMSSGGRTQNINVTVNGQQGMSKATAQQQGREIGVGIRQSMARND